MERVKEMVVTMGWRGGGTFEAGNGSGGDFLQWVGLN